MNKRLLHVVLITMIVVIVPRCGTDRLDMEDASLPLAIGIDLDPKDNRFFFKAEMLRSYLSANDSCCGRWLIRKMPNQKQ